MQVTYLPEEETPTPAFPSAVHSRQLEAVKAELRRWREAKGRRLSIEDRALQFHTRRIIGE